MKKSIVLACCVLAFVVSAASADSLWNEDSASPYSTQKTFKTGDVINIIILENSVAKTLAGTKTDVNDTLTAKLTHNIQRLAPIIGQNMQLNGQIGNKFDSSNGQTARSNNVTARISAWVTDVLPNGNLMIKGQHRVEVNSDVQEITVTGIVRPKDVSGANTVYSYQVASAEVMVKGTGAVADAEAPGWLTRIFNWLF